MPEVSLASKLATEGGIIGAVAFIVACFAILTFMLWRAYEKKVRESTEQDRARIAKLEAAVDRLTRDGQDREERLLGAMERQNETSKATNEILEGVRRQFENQGQQLAALQATVTTTLKLTGKD